MGDLLDIENLLPEMIVALGLALIVGNGLAWWRHRQGQVPQGLENPTFRPGRVIFLTVVGLLMAVWGIVSLVN